MTREYIVIMKGRRTGVVAEKRSVYYASAKRKKAKSEKKKVIKRKGKRRGK